MADFTASLQEAMLIEGALGAALVDSGSGMALATAGEPEGIDLAVAAAGNSRVVQAKLATVRELGLHDSIEDILITLSGHYHVIRTLRGHPELFLYLVMDRERSSLAMARFKLSAIERSLEL